MKVLTIALLFLSIGFLMGILSAEGVSKWERRLFGPDGTPHVNVEILLVPPPTRVPQRNPDMGSSAQLRPCPLLQDDLEINGHYRQTPVQVEEHPESRRVYDNPIGFVLPSLPPLG